MKIILGSSSKWRQQILTEMGLEFECLSPQIDESAIRSPDPRVLALSLARAKSAALAPLIMEPALLITSDQVVTCRGEMREKPASREEARRYLQSYDPDSPAETVTCVVVLNTGSGFRAEGIDTARVYFRALPDILIEALASDPAALSCAGAFRIEDVRMAPFVLRREGDEDSIRGLPAALTRRLLAEAKQARHAGKEAWTPGGRSPTSHDD